MEWDTLISRILLINEQSLENQNQIKLIILNYIQKIYYTILVNPFMENEIKHIIMEKLFY